MLRENNLKKLKHTGRLVYTLTTSLRRTLDETSLNIRFTSIGSKSYRPQQRRCCEQLQYICEQWLIVAWKTYDLKYWRGHMTIYLSDDRLLKLRANSVTNYRKFLCRTMCRCEEKLTHTVPVITSSQIDLLCWYCFKSLSELCYLDIHRLQMLCATIHTS